MKVYWLSLVEFSFFISVFMREFMYVDNSLTIEPNTKEYLPIDGFPRKGEKLF